MPIFEYLCRDCGKKFEKIVQGSARPQCPACASTALDQQFSVFAVGAPSPSSSQRQALGACATCGDPRGPGSCSPN